MNFFCRIFLERLSLLRVGDACPTVSSSRTPRSASHRETPREIHSGQWQDALPSTFLYDV